MSTKAVNTSLALILLMLLSSLSYSVLNDKEEKPQFNYQGKYDFKYDRHQIT